MATLGGCIGTAIARGTANDFAKEFDAHDVKAISARYAPDVVLTEPDGRKIVGREKVAEYFRTFFARVPDAKMEVVDVDLTSIGDGYLTIVKSRISSGGRSVALRSVTKARKVAGEYLVYETSWSTDPPFSELSGAARAPAAAGACAGNRDCAESQVCYAGRCENPGL